MLRRFLVASRYVMVLPVIGSFLAALLVLIFGGVEVVRIAYEAITGSFSGSAGVKQLAVASIQLMDLFLLGTVLYIVALGLYDLFIDESLPMPGWLVIRTLDDLKAKLIGVIIILLAVTFLADVVSWDGHTDILALGISIGLVLFALAYQLHRNFQKSHETS